MVLMLNVQLNRCQFLIATGSGIVTPGFSRPALAKRSSESSQTSFDLKVITFKIISGKILFDLIQASIADFVLEHLYYL